MKAEYKSKGRLRLLGEYKTQQEAVTALESIGVHPHNMVVDGKELFKPKEKKVVVKQPKQIKTTLEMALKAEKKTTSVNKPKTSKRSKQKPISVTTQTKVKNVQNTYINDKGGGSSE